MKPKEFLQLCVCVCVYMTEYIQELLSIFSSSTLFFHQTALPLLALEWGGGACRHEKVHPSATPKTHILLV